MSNVQLKRERDSSEDEDSLNLKEQGFSKKNRFASRQRQRKLNESGFDSDSYDEDSGDDSEDDKKYKKDIRSQNDDDNDNNNDNDNDDMFASEDENPPKKLQAESKTAQDAFDYEDPKYAQKEPLEDDQDVQLEAFDMDENDTQNENFNSMNDGYLHNEEDSKEDQWIDEVKDVEIVAESQRRDNERRRQKLNQVQSRRRHYMVDEALFRLLYFVKPSETVLITLGRFNRLRNHNKSSSQYVINAINFVTDLIDILDHKGIEDIYNLKSSDLSKLIEEESLGGSNSVNNYKTKMWSFKWIQKPDTVHGEYTNYQMQYWKNSYFQHKVAVKICYEPDKPPNWVHIDCINFI